MKRFFLAIFILCASGLSQAQSSNPTLVIQVPLAFHQHPVHLLHPYMNYWHDRGVAAQTVAETSFQARQYSTSSCTSDAQGQALVVIEPNLFYNPQQWVFYSQITARVYTRNNANAALDKPLLTFKTEGQAVGALTHNVELFTHRAYQQAFDRLLTVLQQDPVFQQAVAQAPTQTYGSLCHSIDTLTSPHLFF